MIKLSEHVRSQLIEIISSASDHVLLRATMDTLDDAPYHPGITSNEVLQPPPTFAALPTDDPVVAEKPKVRETPPGFACSRAGAETVAKVLHICRAPVSLSVINELLKRGPGKMEDTKSILKLMWDRKQLTYSDGAYEAAS